ncbi:ParB/RepB/Spo0J family partition protein [Lentzea albidocapillata]|uniref:Chromosome segregation protein Spo0J, contains ParB-like nuclease domain n=1 Tax=Lentzea albidocapillata TaxID=40571 RepID=A0A1W2FGJ2_9PSEU|nr:ParB N-terminal domain-containing protein [Lentzea albidocapillata]SMD20796.1 Chromosome segregation protein Spo0J, contains ParB-like nuclease domain [Lentzea albidocapillata]
MLVDITALRPADSPRLRGLSDDFVRSLASSGAHLPPIVVHRSTMKVVDGTHRLKAAVLRGCRSVEVEYVDGPAEDLFGLAVSLNLATLSTADREAAARRLLRSHPQWSDRAIAASTGLAAKSVGVLRRAVGGQAPVRVGRDGKLRPVNSAAGRRLAGRMAQERPDASLRDIARAAGVSPGTVRDVRRRLSAGLDPVPERMRAAERADAALPAGRNEVRDPDATLPILRRDPSLRFNEHGRLVLRWLEAHAVSSGEWATVVPGVPSHCRELVADMARGCAEAWVEMAEALEREGQRTAV